LSASPFQIDNRGIESELKRQTLALPPHAPRKLSHTRTVVYSGFEREDGLWDIEAALTDVKTYPFIIPSQGPKLAGAPIHGLSIRLTVDDQLKIHDVLTDMAHTPHPECDQAPSGMHRLIGCTLGAGWRRTIDAHIGGVEGCTHLREMLFNMATAAFQTIPHAIQFRKEQAGIPEETPTTPPHFVGKCKTWALDGAVVQRYYPMFFQKPNEN
jgi:hypothetical protein